MHKGDIYRVMHNSLTTDSSAQSQQMACGAKFLLHMRHQKSWMVDGSGLQGVYWVLKEMVAASQQGGMESQVYMGFDVAALQKSQRRVFVHCRDVLVGTWVRTLMKNAVYGDSEQPMGFHNASRTRSEIDKVRVRRSLTMASWVAVVDWHVTLAEWRWSERVPDSGDSEDEEDV